MIKAEWTNKDALDLQPTCNQLATNAEPKTGEWIKATGMMPQNFMVIIVALNVEILQIWARH